MKAFVVSCLAALALAESDPQTLYLNQHPLAYSHLAAPLIYGAKPAVYAAPKPVVYAAPKPVVSYKGESGDSFAPEKVKVEVYSNQEQDKKFEVPAIKYKQPVVTGYTAHAAAPSVYAGPFGYHQVASPVAYAAQVATAETIVPATYHAKSEGEVEHTVYKREAESDAQGFFFGHAAYNPAVYTYSPSVYAAHPSVYAAAHPSVYGYRTPFVSSVGTYANDAVKPQNYAAKGQYVAQSAGAIHVAKREAEAEPQVAFSTPYGTPYVYGAGVYNYARPSVYAAPTYYNYGGYTNGFNYYY